MNFNDCKHLFQLNILHDGFLINWVPLETLRPGSSTNCVANSICFLNLKDRQVSQQLSFESETGDTLGMAYEDITKILQEQVRRGIDVKQHEYPISQFYDFFKEKLEHNSITILNLKRAGLGHTVTIAKTNQGILVMFDPQQQKYYSEPTSDFQSNQENIYTYITSEVQNFISFSVYCENNPFKRKLSELQSIIRRDKTEYSPKKKTRRGGRKKRQKTKKMNRSKQNKKVKKTNKKRQNTKKNRKTRKNKRRKILKGGNDEEDCSICLNKITSDNIITDECNHNFHKDCLKRWCENQSDIEQTKCPLCRKNIGHTCMKLIPFDSKNIFNYTNIAGADDKRREKYIDMVKQFIDDPRFDVNVVNPKSGRSILYSLTMHSPYAFYDSIEKLLQNPNIIIDENIISLLTSKNDSNIISLFKKNNKQVKKMLKGLT